MDESTIKQLMGMVLIIMLIVLNLILSMTCMEFGGCEMLNTYSWGFTNAVVLMVGLTLLGG